MQGKPSTFKKSVGFSNGHECGLSAASGDEDPGIQVMSDFKLVGSLSTEAKKAKGQDSV